MKKVAKRGSRSSECSRGSKVVTLKFRKNCKKNCKKIAKKIARKLQKKIGKKNAKWCKHFQEIIMSWNKK